MREFDLNIERVLAGLPYLRRHPARIDTSVGSVTTHASGRAEVDRICKTV